MGRRPYTTEYFIKQATQIHGLKFN